MPLDHDYERIVRVEEGDVVLDAGAAEGLFSVSIINRAGHIIIIEPSPDYFNSSLAKTFNNVKKVSLVNKGLWNSVEKKKLKLRGWASNILSQAETEIEVDTDTIDNITLTSGFRKIDFIKMDIEGAEIEALEGASYTLSNTRKIVVSAYHQRPDLNLAETCYVVEKMLQDKGFNTLITKDKLVHGWISTRVD